MATRNSKLSSECMPVEHLVILGGSATRLYSEGTAERPAITIMVSELPEGVWLAYSDDLPGLIVETGTRDETIKLARDMALELVDLQGTRSSQRNKEFTFIFPP